MPLTTHALGGRPLRQKELVDRLSLGSSSMVMALANLGAEWLIYWSVDPNNRLAKATFLRPEGLQMVAIIEEYKRALEEEVKAVIAPQDVTTNREILSRIANNIVQITDRVSDGKLQRV